MSKKACFSTDNSTHVLQMCCIGLDNIDEKLV